MKHLQIIVLTLLIGFPLLITSIITQFCVGGGIYFSPKALYFKGNKINPLTGLKRMFSMQSLIELTKSILKVSLLGGIAGIIDLFDEIWDALGLPSFPGLQEIDLIQLIKDRHYYYCFNKWFIRYKSYGF